MNTRTDSEQNSQIIAAEEIRRSEGSETAEEASLNIHPADPKLNGPDCKVTSSDMAGSGTAPTDPEQAGFDTAPADPGQAGLLSHPEDPKRTGSLRDMLERARSAGLPKEEIAGRFGDYLQLKARRECLPLHGTLELTPLCNLDCRMCYVHLSAEQYPAERLMPAGKWISLIDQARELGMIYATLTGGECLTYPEFDRVYLHLYQHGIRTGILSNGLLMTPEWIDFFRRYPPQSIRISVYGSSEEEYEAVTGHRVFERIQRHLRLIREAGLPLSLAVTPNRFMGKNFRNLIQWLEDFGVPYYINASLIPPRKNTGRAREDLSEEQYLELYRIQSEIRGLQLTEPCEVPEPNRDGNGEIREGVICGAGKSTFTLQCDGRMSPCTGLADITTRPLDTGFAAAWKALNEQVRRCRMPSECFGCAYQAGCIRCPAVHRAAPEGHCDPAICERVRRMAAAGMLRFGKRA